MDTELLFISGSYQDISSYFKNNCIQMQVSLDKIYDVLTKGIVYNLYVTERIEEAEELGECIYSFCVEHSLLDNEGVHASLKRWEKITLKKIR